MSIVRDIVFWDTMTGSARKFQPIESGTAKIYSCGPTVYSFAHIGNFRNFVFVDVLRRTLKLFGYDVKHVMNITDIDDKIIRNAASEGISTKDLAQRYEKAFFDDCRFLKLQPMEHYPRATEHIPEMLALVEKLQENGFTYSMDGSVYFKIAQFKGYGKLSKIQAEQMKSGVRVDNDEYAKDDIRDFVLWKGHKPGEPFWETPFGEGRPGWHLECSAMSSRYLGETFDIHTGAEDLIFPHHENEIAQSEGASGKPFVNYWLHCAFLNMKSEKMSKSLGNIVTVHDLADRGFDPDVLRYFLMSVHYRKPLLFSEEGLESAKAAVQRIKGFFQRLNEPGAAGSDYTNPALIERIDYARSEFFAGCADDLNTSRALGAVFELIRDLNPQIENHSLSEQAVQKTISFMKEFNAIADILKTDDELLPEEIECLIAERQEARKNRNFTRSDEIRDTLKSRGIVLEDTREGVRWKKC